MNDSFARIVTAHDDAGLAVIASDEDLTPAPIPSGDAAFALVWTTASFPADNVGDTAGDTAGASRAVGLTSPGGSVLRIVDILPHSQSPMHRTLSIDYGIVLAGAVELELDGGAVRTLVAGDIVVQRGTNHLWRNIGDTTCRIAFVLIDAAPVTAGGRVLDEIHP